MRDYTLIYNTLQEIVLSMNLVWPEKVVIEPPRDPQHGHLATNLALVLAGQTHTNPRELAKTIALSLQTQKSDLLVAEVAGPGFINIKLGSTFWQQSVIEAEKAGAGYGSGRLPEPRKIQVEFVSANPTGPLHIGHGRGAAVGDSLARLLRFAGYDVKTEYYINDAGRQMRLLGVSVYLRAKEACRLPVDWPDDYYHGDYIIDIAKNLLKECPNLLNLPEAEALDISFEYGMRVILDGIKTDLINFGVEHEVWFSERSLVKSGMVEKTLDDMGKSGQTYELDNALWFKSINRGDDKDRVLRKSDGTLTYFASDIAYHHDKYIRGFDELIDVWGADHHGYIPRMKAAISALGRDADKDFSVTLIQLVNLLRGGEQVAMSTRSGEFVTLAEVVSEVGVDAARFMFLSRKSDSHLDFDLDLVKQRSLDNPVYYVQYAHARIAALLRRAADLNVIIPVASTMQILAKLTSPEDLTLLQAIEHFPDAVNDAAKARASHGISYYLMDLAGKLHSYYTNNPILNTDDKELSLARLLMLRSLGQVVANGLNILGVSAPGSM